MPSGSFLYIISAFCKPVLTTQSSSSMLEQTRVDSSDDTTGKFKGVRKMKKFIQVGGEGGPVLSRSNNKVVTTAHV